MTAREPETPWQDVVKAPRMFLFGGSCIYSPMGGPIGWFDALFFAELERQLLACESS